MPHPVGLTGNPGVDWDEIGTLLLVKCQGEEGSQERASYLESGYLLEPQT